MEEKRVARALDKLFADNRINHIQLAHLTSRMMNDPTNDALTFWYDWHRELVIQREYPGQEYLTLDI